MGSRLDGEEGAIVATGGRNSAAVAVAAVAGEDIVPAPAPVAAHQDSNILLPLQLPRPKTSADWTSPAGMAGGRRKTNAGKSAKARRRLRGAVGYVVVAAAAAADGEGIVGGGLQKEAGEEEDKMSVVVVDCQYNSLPRPTEAGSHTTLTCACRRTGRVPRA